MSPLGSISDELLSMANVWNRARKQKYFNAAEGRNSRSPRVPVLARFHGLGGWLSARCSTSGTTFALRPAAGRQ